MNCSSKIVVVDAGYRRGTDGVLLLELAGPLRLRDPEGTDLTPRARKAQGLLALIGTSPNLRRSRLWVQDKLWSDRGPEQGAASLRQCLTEIRSALGRHVGCLRTEAGWIALDPDRVRVLTEPLVPEPGGEVEFLEELDIRDPEFEHWVRDQRMQCSARSGGWPGCCASAAACRAGHPTIALAARFAPGGDHAEETVSDLVLDLVGRSLLDCAVVEVIDLRAQWDGVQPASCARPDCLLHAMASVRNERVLVTLSLAEVEAKRLLWTDAATFDLAEVYAPEQPAVGALVHRATDFVLDRMLHSGFAARGGEAPAGPSGYPTLAAIKTGAFREMFA